MPGTGLSRVKAEPATTTITIDGEKIAEAIRAGIHFEDPPKRAPGRDYGSPAPFTRSLAATDLSHRSL